MKLRILGLAALAAGVALCCCGKPAMAGDETVVCYAALDEEFSKPIMTEFERKTGIQVRMKFDTESTKSVGLANSILVEKARPRCDVFWNNEILNTLRLKKAGLLEVFRPKAAESYPAEFKDADGMWTGFAARGRVLLVNTGQVATANLPRKLQDLRRPEWKGRIGIAKPLFGTTATEVAVRNARDAQAPDAADGLKAFLALLKDQEVKILGGNKGCAQAVASGALAMAFTDTDDAIIEKESGKPVEIVCLDGGAEDSGALFIPNTLCLIKGCPNPENAKKFIEYLLSPEVEIALAKSASAQIPLNPAVDIPPRVASPRTVKAMSADWEKAAELFEATAGVIRRDLLGE